MPGGTDDGDNPDFRNYELMVHEAGHTLGLSGFSLGDLLSEERIYTNAHPKIPDSIMSYDNKTNVREPECSPTPSTYWPSMLCIRR